MVLRTDDSDSMRCEWSAGLKVYTVTLDSTGRQFGPSMWVMVKKLREEVGDMSEVRTLRLQTARFQQSLPQSQPHACTTSGDGDAAGDTINRNIHSRIGLGDPHSFRYPPLLPPPFVRIEATDLLRLLRSLPNLKNVALLGVLVDPRCKHGDSSGQRQPSDTSEDVLMDGADFQSEAEPSDCYDESDSGICMDSVSMTLDTMLIDLGLPAQYSLIQLSPNDVLAPLVLFERVDRLVLRNVETVLYNWLPSLPVEVSVHAGEYAQNGKLSAAPSEEFLAYRIGLRVRALSQLHIKGQQACQNLLCVLEMFMDPPGSEQDVLPVSLHTFEVEYMRPDDLIVVRWFVLRRGAQLKTLVLGLVDGGHNFSTDEDIWDFIVNPDLEELSLRVYYHSHCPKIFWPPCGSNLIACILSHLYVPPLPPDLYLNLPVDYSRRPDRLYTVHCEIAYQQPTNESIGHRFTEFAAHRIDYVLMRLPSLWGAYFAVVGPGDLPVLERDAELLPKMFPLLNERGLLRQAPAVSMHWRAGWDSGEA